MVEEPTRPATVAALPTRDAAASLSIMLGLHDREADDTTEILGRAINGD